MMKQVLTSTATPSVPLNRMNCAAMWKRALHGWIVKREFYRARQPRTHVIPADILSHKDRSFWTKCHFRWRMPRPLLSGYTAMVVNA